MITAKLLKRLENNELRAFEELIQIAVQEALKQLPMVNEYIMKNTAALHKISTKFYDENPDLLNHKKEVASVIEGLENKHPGMNFEDMIKQVPTEVKRRLKGFNDAETKPNELKTLSEIDDVVGSL